MQNDCKNVTFACKKGQMLTICIAAADVLFNLKVSQRMREIWLDRDHLLARFLCMDPDRYTGQNLKKKKQLETGYLPQHVFSPVQVKAAFISIEGRVRVQHQATLSPGEGALRWATCEGSAVSWAVEVDTDLPPPPARVQRVFVNSGPVLEESVHATAVEQFKAGSPSGQGDWAVMKIPQERSEGNSVLLFVMGKRRRQGQ